MFVDSRSVRTAATLSGANTPTDPVNIRGAAFVEFRVVASDAGTLSACTIQTSLDGSNWVSASSSAPVDGRGSLVAETSAAVGIALNAGGAMVCGFPSSTGATLPYAPDMHARLLMSPTTSVAGCAVTAIVFYESRPEPVTNQAFGIA